MNPKRTRSSRPKLFQCKGYGDCNMVFTRSEHLARHARKHTGEKPFVCIVPECKKAFSRFDNMMQHTQTHRNGHHYNTANAHSKDDHRKDGPGDNTRSNTRAQTRQARQGKRTNNTATAACEEQQHQQTSVHENKSTFTANGESLFIQTQQHPINPCGLFSPVSLSSSSPKRQLCSSSSSSDNEDEDVVIFQSSPLKRTRRLSVADLCHPTNLPLHTPPTTIHNLTKDEFEALEGFGRFRHSPKAFFDPLKDVAQVSRYDQ
ncbi:hypothetical protein [Parasitella parasitica]|uniref:C2H2-type domain-containing protein n=1 Tax=Parasitella parasitica TaxID=35722 RepID=A0A0B7NFU5_9FUNG|nr:hypothetical protein [Parasitella parasitica]